MMNIMKMLLTIAIFCNSLFAAEEVSIVALLAAPGKFHNVEVIIDGVVKLEESDPAVFISKEASENNVSTLALGLSLSEDACRLLKERYGNNTYLKIRGVMKVRSKETVNLGTSYQLGYIENVKVLRAVR